MLFGSRGVAGALSTIAVAGALLTATPAAALLVQPIVIDMHSSGTKTDASLTVTNDRRVPVTVEITVNDLKVPETGDLVITPENGDEFLIFPPQVTIQPGHTQVVRIRWVGEPTMPESKLYMFATTELPLNQLKGSGVQVMYSIQSLVTVTSPALKSDLHVVDATRTVVDTAATFDHPAGQRAGLVLTMANEGNAVDLLAHYRLHVKVNSARPWTTTVESTEIIKSLGLGLVPPNARRKLFVAIPDVPPDGDVTATIEHAPEQ
jgi:P pilus assembly chaperone PapD